MISDVIRTFVKFGHVADLMSVVSLYQGGQSRFFATFHSPYGAHYCLSLLLQSHAGFFCAALLAIFSRLTPEKKGSVDYRPSVVVSDVFAILFASKSRACRTITCCMHAVYVLCGRVAVGVVGQTRRCHEIGEFQIGRPKAQRSRELDLARRG